MKIFGIGNADCGDDAAGLLAARRFRQEGCEAIELPGSPLQLLDEWTGAGEVIIFDASQSGAAPGTIGCWNASETKLPLLRTTPSAHAFGLGETLELARSLGRLPRHTWVYTIEGADFALGQPPSPEVLAAIAGLRLPGKEPVEGEDQHGRQVDEAQQG